MVKIINKSLNLNPEFGIGDVLVLQYIKKDSYPDESYFLVTSDGSGYDLYDIREKRMLFGQYVTTDKVKDTLNQYGRYSVIVSDNVTLDLDFEPTDSDSVVNEPASPLYYDQDNGEDKVDTGSISGVHTDTQSTSGAPSTTEAEASK